MSDLIDKQALLEEIENGIRAGNLEEGYWHYPNINNMDDIIETIKYAVVVQPEPKTGHWTFNPELYPEGDIHGHYECDQCGAWVREKTKYCPDCGSKMEVEHD